MQVPSEAFESLGCNEIGTKVFDEETIRNRVAELGQEISEYYHSGELLLVGLLKGSFIFLGDLTRRISRPHKVDFCVVSSYGSGKVSSGKVRLLYDPEVDMKGHHVLLVEDVVETGNTLNWLVRIFRERGPSSVEIVTLLHKRNSRGLDCAPRFVGFDAPREFLVGYGLDFDERYRHLPFVASLKGQDG
jgi:hypoxanthine phosphoribosyltransferase